MEELVLQIYYFDLQNISIEILFCFLLEKLYIDDMEELQAFVTKSFESSESSRNNSNVISLKRTLPKFDATAWLNAIGETPVNHRKTSKASHGKTRPTNGASDPSDSSAAVVSQAVPMEASLPPIPVALIGSTDSELARIAMFKRGTKPLGKVSTSKKHKTTSGLLF